MTISTTCPHCGKTYSGQRVCHCGTCHQTFSGIEMYDRHRHHRGEHGGCLDPETIPAMELRDDMWRGPEMSPTTRAALKGR